MLLLEGLSGFVFRIRAWSKGCSVMWILNYARARPPGEPSYIFARIITYTARLQSLFLRPFAVICDVASRPAVVIYAATIPESEKRRRVTNGRSRVSSTSVFICRL